MKLELNMEFHLDQRIEFQKAVLGFIFMCILPIGCASIDMEPLSNKKFMGFKEEQYYLYDWIDKNVKAKNFIDPMLGSGGFQKEIAIEKAEIEKEILSIIDDAEFYALYIESNVDNGIWSVFLIAHNRTEWIQSAWDYDGHKIALGKPMLRDNWSKRICNFRFSDDIVVDTGKYHVVDETSVFLFIYCHDRLRRFVVYNPRTTVYWDSDDSDDRYTRQIQRIVRHIRRNYLWFRLTKK